MKQEFVIKGLKTISVNAMYTTKRFITAAYSEWLRQVKHKLEFDEAEAALADLKNTFNPKLHKIHVTIKAYYKSFYNKAGEISAHTHDCSNFEKGILDVFCGEGHLNLFNDKHITRVVSEKFASDTDYFSVEFEILER